MCRPLPRLVAFHHALETTTKNDVFFFSYSDHRMTCALIRMPSSFTTVDQMPMERHTAVGNDAVERLATHVHFASEESEVSSAPIESGYVTPMNLAYEIYGTGPIHLLFLSGATQPKSSYAAQVQYFTQIPQYSVMIIVNHFRGSGA